MLFSISYVSKTKMFAGPIVLLIIKTVVTYSVLMYELEI